MQSYEKEVGGVERTVSRNKLFCTFSCCFALSVRGFCCVLVCTCVWNLCAATRGALLAVAHQGGGPSDPRPLYYRLGGLLNHFTPPPPPRRPNKRGHQRGCYFAALIGFFTEDRI